MPGISMQHRIGEKSAQGGYLTDGGLSRENGLPTGGDLERDDHETLVGSLRPKGLKAKEEAHQEHDEQEKPLLPDYPVLIPLHPGEA